MNTDLRKTTKSDFEDLFRLMSNSVFRKAMENVRKYRDKKVVATEKKRNNLVSEPNFDTRKFSTENLLATEMNKTEISVNIPVYLGLSILILSKILTFEFWYDYVKQFNCIHKNRWYLSRYWEDVETRFDASITN